MTSQEAKGSFMVMADVVKYFNENGFEPISDEFWEDNIEIDGTSYMPTSIIEPQLTVQEWRTMQSKVTTSMFGLEPMQYEEIENLEEYFRVEKERITNTPWER